MAAWEGFSDADLVKIKGTAGTGGAVHTYRSPPKMSTLGQAGQRKPAASRPKKASKAHHGSGSGAVNARPQSSTPEDQRRRAASSATTPELSGKTPPPVDTGTGSQRSSRTSLSGGEEEKTAELRPCTEDEVQTLKKTRLEELHEQQKKLEKVNMEKKVQLQKTIVERRQQAQQETERLATVQKELSHLDNIISTDVSIIREKIEEATAAYTAAKNRYDAAEMEFVTAKTHLHHCSEQKELLMEHLITIIEQTEVRKADKLAELMGTLDASEQKMISEEHASTGNTNIADEEKLPEQQDEGDGDDDDDQEEEESPPEPVTLLGLAQSESGGEDTNAIVENS